MLITGYVIKPIAGLNRRYQVQDIITIKQGFTPVLFKLFKAITFINDYQFRYITG